MLAARTDLASIRARRYKQYYFAAILRDDILGSV